MKSTTYRVEIHFTEPVLGTVPKSKDVYTKYILSKAPDAEEAADEVTSVQDAEERNWTGFHELNGKPFVFDYYLKGFLKETANVLKDQLGVTNMKSKVENYVFVKPRRIFFEPINGKIKYDELERPLRAQTAQGPRVTLTRSDSVEEAKLVFTLTVLDGPIHKKHLEEILSFGELRGCGQWRNGGYGRFTVVKFEEIGD